MMLPPRCVAFRLLISMACLNCTTAVHFRPRQGNGNIAPEVSTSDTSEPVECSAAESDVRIVFSTGCNQFQNWQAEVLLNSAYHAGQCGKMTRIVAGCDTDDADTKSGHFTSPGSLQKRVDSKGLTKSIFPNLNVHMAPSIPEARQFPWFNKPWSFHHWLQHNSESLERVIIILDPDQFFIRPLTQAGSMKMFHKGEYKNLAKDVDEDSGSPSRPRWAQLHSPTDIVQPGTAVAQAYGLGINCLRHFDQKKVCPGMESSPCARLSQEDAMQYYGPAGPPYLLHRDDFKKITPLWWDLMKPIYEQTPESDKIHADMYAYNYAAIHHGVKHSLFEDYMVSQVDDPQGEWDEEDWEWIDNLDSMSCREPVFAAGQPSTVLLHVAQHYKACSGGDETNPGMTECDSPGSELWNFHKGHVPGEILSCDHPLLVPPPDDLFNTQVEMQKSRDKSKSFSRDKRNAFMVCNSIYLINRAALDYKRKFCEPGFNEKKCTRLVVDPNRHTHFNATNPWRYPLAKVDADCCPECGKVKR